MRQLVVHKTLATLWFGLLICSCGESYEQRQAMEKAIQEEASSHREAKRTQDIQELAQRYNADVTWSEGIQKGGLTTARLSASLIRKNDRPLIVRGLLIDIAPQGNSHKITFRASGIPEFSVSGQHLLFEVTCALSPTEMNALRPSSSRFVLAPPDILAITNVSDVRSSHSIIGERTGDSSFATIQSIFTAVGDCLLVKPDRID